MYMYVIIGFSQIKDYKQKVGNLKKNHQSDKNNQQQVLEEARKNASDDTNQLKVGLGAILITMDCMYM